jgi:hypothetical protein
MEDQFIGACLTRGMPPDAHRKPTGSRNGVDPYTAWTRWIGYGVAG